MMDALEWPREDSRLSAGERDRAVDELIAIVGDVDAILKNQSAADVDYFSGLCNRLFSDDEVQGLKKGVLKAYRWQYIFSGITHLRFQKLYNELTTKDQRQRINKALAPLDGGA
jgi:hypothetical protein